MQQLYFGTLLLASHCYCGNNIKYGMLSKYLLQRKKQQGGYRNLRVTINVLKNVEYQISHGIKIIQKSFFLQIILLKVCDSFLFRPSKNTYTIHWSV